MTAMTAMTPMAAMTVTTAMTVPSVAPLFAASMAAVDEAMPWIEARRWWLLIIGAGVLGFALIVWAIVARRRDATARRCPKCGFDMRSTPSLRCGECGRVASSERALLRLRPWQRRTAMLAGMLIAVAYPAYRTVLWSHDRGWTPPLSEWKVVESHRLVNGARVEIVERRHHREEGRACRMTARDGSNELVDGHRFQIIAGVTARDVTGDGQPNLVIMEYSGGAHCCETYFIYALTPDGSAHLITTIDARDGGSFIDLDGDGIDEFETHDWSLAYELTCFACLDYPRIVLRFETGEYRVCAELMRRPAPTDSERAATAASIRADIQEVLLAPRGTHPTPVVMPARVRDRIWSEMLKLIYTGHARLAFAFLDDAWPVGIPDRDKDLRAFREAIAASPFLAAIEAMQPQDP